MSNSKQEKNLQINLQFKDADELTRVFRVIHQLVSGGIQHYKEERNESSFEYSLNYFNEVDCKEELIGGKRTIVLQSKMNKKTDDGR